MIFRKVL